MYKKIPICVNVVNLYSVERHNSSYWSPYLPAAGVTLFSRTLLLLTLYPVRTAGKPLPPYCGSHYRNKYLIYWPCLVCHCLKSPLPQWRVNHHHLLSPVNLTQTKSYLIASKFVEKYKTWHVLHDILSDWATKYII